MADRTGIKITKVTESGSSDDGEYIWITHRLGDGSEYPLIYPCQAVGCLITVLTDAARTAYKRRAVRYPREAMEGMDTYVIPVGEVKVATAPDNSGAILHLTTGDNIPIAVAVPATLLTELAEQLRCVCDRVTDVGSAKVRLH